MPGYVAHISGNSQNEYALPFFGVPSQEPCWFWSGDLSKAMVLGENGVAFGTDGKKAVSFDIGSGTVNWTWEAPSGELEMIAATAGNGLVVKDTETF